MVSLDAEDIDTDSPACLNKFGELLKSICGMKDRTSVTEAREYVVLPKCGRRCYSGVQIPQMKGI